MTDVQTLTPPAFCSLDRAAYTERMAQIMAMMLKFEGRVENAGEGKVLRFKHGEGLKPALEWLIAAERSCCSALVLELEEGDEEYALHVLAPAASEPSRSSSCC